MSFLLWQSDAGAGIASARQVLRAAEVPLLESAAALAAHLGALLAQETQRMAEADESARRDGLARGMAEGEQAAQRALAAQLVALAHQASAEREAQRREVAALAMEVTRKLVGQLPADLRLAALAEQAARELLPARTLRLHVHPSRLAALQERVLALAAQDRSGLAQAEVRADATLAPEACRLDTDLGSADATVDAQLARLAAAWGVEPPP